MGTLNLDDQYYLCAYRQTMVNFTGEWLGGGKLEVRTGDGANVNRGKRETEKQWSGRTGSQLVTDEPVEFEK